MSRFFDATIPPRATTRRAADPENAAAEKLQESALQYAPSKPPRLRVLVADVAAMDARIRAIFAGDDLTFAHSLDDVCAQLGAADFDLIVVCERFESSGFELISLVTARQRATPVACIRSCNPLLADPRTDGYKQTVLALGARAVADVWAGSAVEYDRIRRTFYRCVDRRTRLLRSTAYSRVLLLALETAGSRDRLAGLLGVTLHELADWIAGGELPPFEAYCAALDVVAAGPYAAAGVRDERRADLR